MSVYSLMCMGGRGGEKQRPAKKEIKAGRESEHDLRTLQYENVTMTSLFCTIYAIKKLQKEISVGLDKKHEKS